jgi:hypothetical protein
MTTSWSTHLQFAASNCLPCVVHTAGAKAHAPVALVGSTHLQLAASKTLPCAGQKPGTNAQLLLGWTCSEVD